MTTMLLSATYLARPVVHGNSGGSSSGWEFWLGGVFIVLVLAYLGVRQLTGRGDKS